jgi:hypothetical protein
MECYKLGSRERAKTLCEESLDLLHVRLSPRQRRAVALAKGHMGWVLCTLGDPSTGDQLMREAVALFEEVNDSRGRAAYLKLLAATPHLLGTHQKPRGFWSRP